MRFSSWTRSLMSALLLTCWNLEHSIRNQIQPALSAAGVWHSQLKKKLAKLAEIMGRFWLRHCSSLEKLGIGENAKPSKVRVLVAPTSMIPGANSLWTVLKLRQSVTVFCDIKCAYISPGFRIILSSVEP